MNRSLTNVIFGAVGLEQDTGSDGQAKEININSYSTEEAAMIFDTAEKIIVVPGYGLAVAQAQHAVREVADYLSGKGKKGHWKKSYKNVPSEEQMRKKMQSMVDSGKITQEEADEKIEYMMSGKGKRGWKK